MLEHGLPPATFGWRFRRTVCWHCYPFGRCRGCPWYLSAPTYPPPLCAPETVRISTSMEPRSSKAETTKAQDLIKPPCAWASLMRAGWNPKADSSNLAKSSQLDSDQAICVQALKLKPSELAS